MSRERDAALTEVEKWLLEAVTNGISCISYDGRHGLAGGLIRYVERAAEAASGEKRRVLQVIADRLRLHLALEMGDCDQAVAYARSAQSNTPPTSDDHFESIADELHALLVHHRLEEAVVVLSRGMEAAIKNGMASRFPTMFLQQVLHRGPKDDLAKMSGLEQVLDVYCRDVLGLKPERIERLRSKGLGGYLDAAVREDVIEMLRMARTNQSIYKPDDIEHYHAKALEMETLVRAGRHRRALSLLEKGIASAIEHGLPAAAGDALFNAVRGLADSVVGASDALELSARRYCLEMLGMSEADVAAMQGKGREAFFRALCSEPAD